VTRLSSDTVLAPLPDRDGRGFALRAGGARFSVPHDPDHPFVVAAGDVTIEDLGTTFTVRYLSADRLKIAVEEGRVRVRAVGTDTEVPAGATLEVPVSPAVEGPRTESRPAGVAASSWRPLAERGQYEEARRALRKAGPSAVRDDTADLLLAADAARLSGHPAEAVPYLERVLRGHARDPRTGLAAFTLGRVLLDELGRPSEAVDAFALARSSGGPLAEDALAREVEALSRAGDVTRSRELALLYRRLYPNGRRAKAVSRFGGLD
jgi:transmembrane sensor